MKGVQVVVSAVGLTVPVGVDPQIGTINSIVEFTVSVSMLFLAMMSSCDAANLYAMVWRVSPS